MSFVEQDSTFRLYAIGVAAADKPADSHVLEVFPYEKLPFYEGGIVPDTETVSRTGKDTRGEEYTINFNLGITVKANWLGLDARVTAPNVVKGERIFLYTVGDSEIYYWVPMGLDTALRRTESVIFQWVASSLASEDGKIELTNDNTYRIYVDTKNKHMTFTTSMDNGEKARWFLQMNGKDGSWFVNDEKGNEISIDSVETIIELINAEKTRIQLDKKDINMYAPNDMNILVDNDVNLNVGNNVNVEIGGNLTWKVAGDINGTGDGNRTTKISGNDDADISGNGTVKVGGNYNLKAAMGMLDLGATATIKASAITIDGAATFTSPVRFGAPVVGTSAVFGGGVKGASMAI